MAGEKVFLDHEELVQRLIDLGLHVADPGDAARELRRLGYHRTASYRYPFRELLPPDRQRADMREFRTDRFMPGARFEHSVELADFDTKLRHVVFSGLLDLEIRLRTAVAHVLARRDPGAHLEAHHLDSERCRERTASGRTRFEAWTAHWHEATQRHRTDDFVSHHLAKYGSPLPVWAVVELLPFGSLVNLVQLMKQGDRNEVGRRFGVRHGNKFQAWLLALVDLRNVCAHGQRLFNRTMKRAVAIAPAHFTGGFLDHLAYTSVPAPEPDRKKLYWIAAVMAHMLRSHESPTQWHRAFATQVKKLPVIRLSPGSDALVTPEGNMGFHENWSAMDLWNREDKSPTA
jgi:abortive infection bacteriophage resistance protein